MSSMFRGVKHCLFKQSCQQRLAVAAVQTAAKRAEQQNGKQMSEKEKITTIKDKVAADLKAYVPGSFWPEFWLAFLMCSVPINEIVSTRKLGLVSLFPIEKRDTEAVPAPLGKKARQEERKVAAATKGTASASADVVDLSEDGGASKSNIVFTHVLKEPAVAPFQAEILQATSHRKFLLEELTRVGSMTYVDDELVHELNAELNDVSRRLRRLYNQQQQQQTPSSLPTTTAALLLIHM